MSFFNVAAGERRVCAVITRLPVYGSAEQWKASGQGFCVHEPEVQTQSRSREHTSDRIFAKLLREGLCQALKPSPAARRRPDAPPQQICCKSYTISVLQRATTTRSAKLQRRELCVAIVLEAGLCCEKLGRGGIAIFAGLSGFDPLRVDACADSSVR